MPDEATVRWVLDIIAEISALTLLVLLVFLFVSGRVISKVTLIDIVNILRKRINGENDE